MATEDKNVPELNDAQLEEAAGGYQVYVVKPGDTLGRIAKAYGTTWQKLAKCNDIANPNLIHPGDRIKICY